MFSRPSYNSFDRVFCERLSVRITRGFEKREEDLRAKSDQKALKLAEKKQANAEKKLKKAKDKTEKEKWKRYFIILVWLILDQPSTKQSGYVLCFIQEVANCLVKTITKLRATNVEAFTVCLASVYVLYKAVCLIF